MEQSEKKSFPEELNDAILAYKDDPHEDSYCRLLCCVLDGITEDVSVPIPADMDFEKMSVRPRFQTSHRGENGLVVLTDPDGEKYPEFASVKLRAVMRILLNDEKCSGILLNPEESNEVLIRKELLVSAIGAGLGMLEGRCDPADQSEEDEQTSLIQRPISEEAFEQIEEKISSFRNDPADYLVLNLIKDKDMLFLRTCRNGDLCHIELAFDMSDFDWDQPLILGNELPLGEALSLLYRLLVDGSSPDDIEEIQNSFHQIDSSGDDEQPEKRTDQNTEATEEPVENVSCTFEEGGYYGKFTFDGELIAAGKFIGGALSLYGPDGEFHYKPEYDKWYYEGDFDEISDEEFEMYKAERDAEHDVK